MTLSSTTRKAVGTAATGLASYYIAQKYLPEDARVPFMISAPALFLIVDDLLFKPTKKALTS